MTRQLEIFEDIADATRFVPNLGERSPHTPKRKPGPRTSPTMLHAKVAREAPADSPSEPEAIPPAVPRLITSVDDLLDLLRRRRDELDLTHDTIDHIAGWASGYASKTLSPEPLKGLGEKSLGLLLDVLALGIARVEIVEDPEKVVRMRRRWTRRVRPRMRPRRTRSQLTGALLDKSSKQTLASTTETANVETPSELPPQA